MGVAEIVIFAACWLVVASLMLWGVFSEGDRGVRRLARRRRTRDWEPVRTSAPTDWIVLESTAGTGPETEAQARMVASALLASRGIDMELLPAGDLKTEVTTASDGAGTTRILVRAGAVHASRRQR
ncbi:MAG: hypothetical protein KGQ66_04285 [Acidobacteriota bacterium]|nr:hypothetical protein [Acidobacteriota bacterium]